MDKPQTWEEFLLNRFQQEFGVKRTKEEALVEILNKPLSDNPNDATNVIINMLNKQLKEK